MAGISTEGAAPAPPALGLAPPLIRTREPATALAPAGTGGGRGGVRLWLATLVPAAALTIIAFYAKGGLSLPTMTVTEIVLTICSGLLLTGAALWMTSRRPAAGLWPSLLLLGFAMLSGLSVVWSIQPENSWRDAGRLLAYAAVFAAAALMARLTPRRWPALLGAIAISAVVICGYALLGKCLPEQFPEANHYARLYEPYGYWNALGLTAAMGAISCMWLGARRAGHALLSALAYPAMGVLLLTLLLAYSRGALMALLVGLALWFLLVPLRLRGAAVLISGAIGAGAIAAWDFSDHALSSEGVAVSESASAGHELGALVIAMVLLLAAVGMAATFASARRPPPAALRRRAGMVLLGSLVVLVLAFLGALAHSHRGLTGSVSHAFHTLTNTHASVPNTPGRLTAIASVRAQYWKEALQVFDAHPVVGVGADAYEVARLRYRTTAIDVKHAHGFIVQTMADLGVVGLLVALALLLTWMAAAGRATHPGNRRWRSWQQIRSGQRPAWQSLSGTAEAGYTPERVGLLTLLCVVAVFGIHSLIDWTWYVPGDAIVALLGAGWLAGRGQAVQTATPPRTEASSTTSWSAPWRAGRPNAGRIALATLALAATVLTVWSQWQPQRSEDARESALSLLAANPAAALADARTAVSRDPLSVEALFALADVQSYRGDSGAARATLAKAVRQQPSNPLTWLTLGRFDLAGDPRAALSELRAGIFLNPILISPEELTPGHPEAIGIYNDYIEALRRSKTTPASVKTESGPPARAARDERREARRQRALRHHRNRTPQAAP